MTVKIKSGTCYNLEGMIIDVEVDITKGMPNLYIVGLPDASVREARERVRSAIINNGFNYPMGRITVSLAPADVKKMGSLLDLPIALAILIHTNQINNINLEEFIIFGELSLSGEIKSVRGTLPIILQGKEEGVENYIFPYDNINECTYDCDVNCYPFSNIKEVVSFINFKDSLPWADFGDKEINENKYLDFAKIIGQESSKRAMLIGACGMHNIMLYGSTGCGKTMLANALPSILPDLSFDEELEVAKIYSIMGLMPKKGNLLRPFRNPHHTITVNALVGGGTKVRVGEVTLAHKGVLFLDEILEFKKEVLEGLREPLEEGRVRINRIQGNYEFPANFLLIGAFNLCPCGKKIINNDFSGEDGCSCSDFEIRRYMNKFSKAMRDRMDIFNYVPKIGLEEIEKNEVTRNSIYDSKYMKNIVEESRLLQIKRLEGTKYRYNSEIKGKDIFELCNVSTKVQRILEQYFNECKPSLRAYGKVIKLARTISDMSNRKDIKEVDIIEAISYRKDSYGNIL